MDDKDRRKEHGRTALNQEFIRYDQVNKNQTYLLTENPDVEAYDEEYRIKTCDFSEFLDGGREGKARFAQSLGMALEEIGFAILIGHGTAFAVYQETKAKILEFFSRTNQAERLCYRAQRHGSVNQGYFPIKETSDIHPDLVEGWVFCRRAFAMDDNPFYRVDDFWPLPEMEVFFREYVKKHEVLFLPLMQSMLRYLGCDPHSYDQKLTGTNFGLRLNYYPPLDDVSAALGAGRILGHEDVNMFTLLPAPDIEGLQVLNRKNLKWIRLDAPPGSIIINTGDYMQRLSNDRFSSTTHRVSQPRDPALRLVPRISFPLAVYLREDEIMEVFPELPDPKYPPIKALNFHTQITSKYYGDDYAVVE